MIGVFSSEYTIADQEEHFMRQSPLKRPAKCLESRSCFHGQYDQHVQGNCEGENDDGNDDTDQYKRPEEYLLCRLLRWPSFFSMTYRGCNSYLFP